MRRIGLLTLLAACGGGGGFPDARVIDAAPKGSFSATWSVIDQNSQPLSCDRIGGQTMTVLAHNKAFDGGLPELFGCSEGSGTSEQIVAGIYDFGFELSGTVGLLATAPAQMSVAIPAGTVTPIQPLVFQVQATGALNLLFASGKAGGNCGATPSGAGIDGVTITMTSNSNAACAPIQLTIGTNATHATATTYMIDCTAPVVAPCIDADQAITASGIASDGYTIHVTGKIGTKSCWINNDTLPVPPLDKTLTRTLNLSEQTQISGC